MIYGLNFNGTQIPDGWKRRFAKQTRVPWYPKVWFVLQGVGTDRESMLRMVEQAHNGRRNIHVKERATAAGPAFGVYTY